MADRIQQRRDTAENWSSYNPILLEGEIGYVTDNPSQYKIGDGVHAWNDLPLRGFDGTLVHELGDSETAAMSQKGVTEVVNKINSNTGIDEYPVFSDQTAYKAGDVVNYNGLLYTFTTDHAIGAWDESQVENASLKGELTNLSLKIDSIPVSSSSNNLFSEINTIKGYYIKNDGIHITSDKAWFITKPIEIKEDTINFSDYSLNLTTARKFAIFAINGTFIRASTDEEEINNKYARKNNNENFIVFSISKNSKINDSNFVISYKEVTGEEKKSYGNENSDVLYNDLLNSIENETLRLKNDVNTINIIDLSKCEFGKFINEHGIIAEGREYYCVSDYIYIKENDTICSNAVNTIPCSPYSVYDENKELIRTSGINNDNTYKYSQGDVYVRFCFNTRKQKPMANFGEVLYDCEYTIENPLKLIQNIFSTYTDKFKSVDYIKYDKKFINAAGVISNAEGTWYLKVINAKKGKTYYITTLFGGREYIDGWGFYGTLPLETDIINGISVNNAVYANNDDISKNLLSIFHCNEDCLLVVSLSSASSGETEVYVKDIPAYIGIDSLLDKCHIIEYKDNVTEWESAEFTPDASKFVYIETIDKLGSCIVDIIGVNGNVLLGTIDIDDIKYFDPSYYAVYNHQSTFKLRFKGQFYASRIFILQYQNNIGFVGRLNSLESKINENSSSIQELKVQENKNIIVGSDGEKYKISIGDNKNIIAIPIIPLKAFYTGNSLMSGNGTDPYTGMNATENKYDWVHRISNYFQSKNSSFNFTCVSSKPFETASSAEEQDEFLNNTLKTYLNSDLDLIIIQIGDNVSKSNGTDMSEWANGCLKYCKFVREKAPNARVCWMFAWYNYNNAKVINPIIDACNKYGVEMIDIRGYEEIISNQSKIGEVVKANNPQSKTIVYDELNYNEQNKTLTIKFTLNEKQYTSVVPVESYEDNAAEKTVTWVGEWSVTTIEGIATHPSNEGFRVISNKILYTLGCEGENYFTE